MAKLISQREPRTLPYDRQIPMIKVDDATLWSPPQGLDLTHRLSRLAPGFASAIQNMMLDDGVLRSRPGTTAFGGALTSVMAVVGFVTPSGVGHIIKVTLTGIDQYNGSTWDAVASNVFNGGTSDYFSFAAWGDEILMCNGVDKIYRFNPRTGEKGFIDESFPAKHIQTFGGRVIASNVIDGSQKVYRVRWSVKNNNVDWTGDGSGFEDLFSAPGGRVDAVHGCFPITDDTALLMRENTIWQMSLTGQVTAPFRFTELFPEVGTRYRRAITAVPGGYMMVSRDNVIAVNAGGVTRLGDVVRESLLDSITDDDAVVAKYDFQREEFRVAIGTAVWRYAFRDKGWTKDVYPQAVRDMTYMSVSKLGKSIDSLSGTIDDLTGTIDELVTASSLQGFFFVGFSGTNCVLAREDDTIYQDTNTTPAQADSAIIVATGLLQAASPLDKTKVIECQLEYEAGQSQTLLFEYSTDKGGTWTTYSSKDIVATSGPQVLSVRKTLVGHNLQLRVRSTKLGDFSLLSFVPRIVQEARVNP